MAEQPDQQQAGVPLPAHIAAMDGPTARRRLALTERERDLWRRVAMVPLPQRLVDHVRTRAAVAAEYVLQRTPHLHAWLRAQLTAAGYVIRPYDPVGDRRRWRWQRRAQCGRAWWATLDTKDRTTLTDAARTAYRSRRAAQ